MYCFVSTIPNKFPPDLYASYLQLLPDDQQKRNHQYLKWEDRHAHLIGRLLILEGFKYLNFSDFSLNDLQYSKFGRPSISSFLDFNISHSHSQVICAFRVDATIGVDIEYVSVKNFDDYTEYMNAEQWLMIQTSEHPLKTFHQLWTIKESVLKAQGMGLQNPMRSITLSGNRALLHGTSWHIQTVNIASEYCCALASDKPIETVVVQEIQFDNPH